MSRNEIKVPITSHAARAAINKFGTLPEMFIVQDVLTDAPRDELSQRLEQAEGILAILSYGYWQKMLKDADYGKTEVAERIEEYWNDSLT